MGAEFVGRQQTPGGVVDAAGQGFASVLGSVQIEIKDQVLTFRQRLGVDRAQVVLAPGVGVVRAEQAGVEPFDRRVAHPHQVEAVALFAVGVIDHKPLVMTGGVAVGALVEMSAIQGGGGQFATGQQPAGGGFRQQAAVG